MSNRIWEYAEIGLQEFKSSKLLADTLEEHGFVVDRGVAGMPTALVATFGSGRPIIGFLGEFDALPGLSQKAVPHREPLKEGAPGHGCGHNVYAASGIGAAIATKVAVENGKMKGTVRSSALQLKKPLTGRSSWFVKDASKMSMLLWATILEQPTTYV